MMTSKSKSALFFRHACLLSACAVSACGTDTDTQGANTDSTSDLSSAEETTSNTTGIPSPSSSTQSTTSSTNSTRESSTATSAHSQGTNASTTSHDAESTNGGSTHTSASTNTTTIDQSDEPSASGTPDAGATSDDTSTSSDENDSTSSEGTSTSSDTSTNSDCEFSGTVSYRINNPESFPTDALEKLTAALEEAIYYYNCYSDLSHSLTINYKPSVPTAEGNVDGVISFGSDRNYMVVATVMHEIGHTMGVGYAPWSELIQDGKWMGPAVDEYMTNLPANERDPDSYSQRTYITCDSQHFWPYGLNQASEHQSEWSLINHVRVVAAMNKDKDAFR